MTGNQVLSFLYTRKSDRKECTNYQRISLLSLPGKVYAKCFKRKCREIMESKLKDGQCGFRPNCIITNQIFTLKQIFEKSWGYAKNVFACFVDLDMANDRVLRNKLWSVLRKFGIDGRRLLMAISHIYC